MAKVSTNPIETYEQDWGNDPKTGLPFSGEAVQKFIKDELRNKLGEADAETKIKEQLKSQLFGGGTNKVVTDVDGNSEVLSIVSRDSDGKSTSKDINIGTPDANDRFVTVTTQLSKQYINVGGEVKLALGFTVADYQGELIPNSYANVSMEISRQGSSNPFYRASLGTLNSAVNAQTPNHEVDLTSIIANNITGSASVVISITVSYTYEYVDDSGERKTKTITKYGSVILTVLALSLSTSINIANTGMTGQVSIPYTVKGNGSKTVFLYRNGVLIDQHDNITSTSSSGVFTQTLSSGINNFQLVAETSAGDTVVRSSSFYFDLFSSTIATVIALLVEDTTGTIQSSTEYETPKFYAPKFSDFKFNYYVYNSTNTLVPVKITTNELDSDGKIIVSSPSDQELYRKVYTYSKKIKSSNQLKIIFESGDSSRIIYINPLTSSINIELPTESLRLNLDADGRSNEEVNPAVWSYGSVTTEFTGLNWQSNGWVDNALLLQNGAKAKVNFPLFQSVNNYPVTKGGCAFEILFKCSNATLEEHDIISCHWMNNDNRKTGLNITTSYVGVDTGEVTEYKDDDGKVTQSVVTRVGSQYAQDNWYKYTFVIDPNAPGIGANKGLCYGYLNGILSYIAPIPSSFINLDKLPITIDSTYADVYVKSIKYYDAPLTHDQCVDEHIIDQETSADIESLYNKNSVLAQDANGKDYVSPQKLRAMGRGVMIISPSTEQVARTTLQDLNKSSNKKSYYGPFRVDYYAPESDLNLGYSTVPAKGNQFNFMHTQCAIRIQGTTSTKRPRKNYRLHFNKKDGDSKPAQGSFIVGGEVRNNFKYAMSQDAIAVPIACLKVDYVDSSMTHNTGGAVVFNEMTRNVESLRNPAQVREYVSSPTDIKTRVAIEGFPIDVFAADGLTSPTDEGEYRETLEDSRYTNLVYMGQYNYNNDKSKSGAVFGFDGSYNYDQGGNYAEDGAYQPICIEFLDNNADLDLFKVKFTSSNNIDDAATYGGFADALEVRAPEDVTDQVADYGLDSLKTAVGFEKYAYIPDQVKRVFSFIGECAKQVAQNNGKAAITLNTMTSDEFEALDWSCEKFINEAKDYFNLSSVCAWYIWTDYLIAVDQRAKNMMMYTMDGKHWMFQYYDGDTMLGERNDCFLAYDYLTDRTTWDDAVKQYAMQGHDSWLWYLIRANFTNQRILTSSVNGEEVSTPDPKTAINLSSVCKLMRGSGKFSADYFKQVLNGQFVNNWSQRQYNYSQDYKYVQPLTETGYPSDISTNFINTAQGSREAHRTYTLENRFSLLDSKYQAGNYSQDAFVYYAAAGNVNNLKIVSSIPYYFGWNTSNTSIREHQAANADNNYTVNLTITGNAANNPANVLGASRIKELEFSSQSAWTVDSTKDVKLPNLHKLIAKNMGTKAAGDLWLTACPLLTYVDISGSSFSGLYGLENSSKMVYLNVENTSVKSVRLADGSPLETIKLSTPQEVYLSNLDGIVFNNSAEDTITAQNWTELNKLLINNCPNVDWEKMVLKLLNSSASRKYLRVTGINKQDSITWLDQFDGIYGLDADGGEITTGAQLVGTLQLLDYTDDNVVAEYRAKFPSLDIKQPEYTIIETNETVAQEQSTTENSMGSTTNLDNNTGYRFSTTYVPSGHIKNILSRCHRYLGKLVTPGNSVTLVGNPNDPSPFGQQFQGRDNTGTMLLCQLADANSTYFNTGYASSSTRRVANLNGEKGNGEVYVKIPGFWYKGINYTPANNSQAISFRYTCYSSYEEKPSKSNETRVLSIDDLNRSPIEEGYNEGLYKADTTLEYTEIANGVADRESPNTGFDLYRINVQGYKKIRFPASVGTGCCLFTADSGKIIANSTGSVVGVGELFVSSGGWLYTGMPVIATIPAGAKYFYLVVKKFISGSITTDPCDIVLHKGSKFSSGDEMTDRNAKDWIADMEPDWVYSEPVCIAAAECAGDGIGGLYSPFDGLNIAAIGTENKENNLISKEQWFQYSMREAAYKRGLQLIDYEATKLIANLFIAKYGRRNSQNQLGAGSRSVTRKLGSTREYGMTDTVIPDGKSVTETWEQAAIPIIQGTNKTFKTIESPNFIGIENIHGNVCEWLDRAYYANETDADCGKIRITNSDLSIRRLYSISPSGGYTKSLVHGKFCDIASCSSQSGTSVTFYPDYQKSDSALRSTWASTMAIKRSYSSSITQGGVFTLYSIHSVGFSDSSSASGSRLLFRGNIIETTDIDEFLETEEYRGVV